MRGAAKTGTGIPDTPFTDLEKGWYWLGRHIGQQAFQAIGSNLDAGALRIQEHRFAGECIHQSEPGVAFKHKEPRLVPGMKLPVRFRQKVDPLKYEMRTGDEKGSGIGEAPLNGLAFSRSCMCGRHGVACVKFTLPAVVEKAEGGVASLLDLGDDKSGPDGVDRTGGHENGIVLLNEVPLNQVYNRAVLDGRPQLGGSELPLQSDSNFGAGRCGKNIPSLGLSVRQANRLREGIVGVNLDGQRFLCKQQLEQQCGGWSGQAGTLKPQLTDRFAVALKSVPGPRSVLPQGLCTTCMQACSIVTFILLVRERSLPDDLAKKIHLVHRSSETGRPHVESVKLAGHMIGVYGTQNPCTHAISTWQKKYKKRRNQAS